MIRVPNLPSLACEQQESVLWKEDQKVHQSDPVSASKFLESESLESELDLTSLLSTATLDDANSVPLTTPTTHSTHESTASFSHNRPHSFDPSAQQQDYLCQEKYLQLVEPTPVFPPQYHTLPPGGCPRFPVLDDVHPSDNLPAYTPAAYKIGIVARKIEWVSPFQPASSRSWKNVIIELNSTQVNIYRIPSHLESYIMSFCRLEEQNCETNVLHKDLLASQFTTPKDISFFSLCVQLGILAKTRDKEGDQGSAPKFTKPDFQLRLLRSYSLLHAKVGLASDYCKKPNVLRLRLENEQLLLHFFLARDLIEWHLGLSVGQDVAADILEREAPKYRTVPRRRRGQSCSLSNASNHSLHRNRRTRSSSMPSTPSGLRSTFFHVKQRISPNNSIERSVTATTKRLASQGSLDAKELAVNEDNNKASNPDKLNQPLDDGNEDINNLSDLHRSDEDEDEDEDDDDDEVDDDMDVGDRNNIPTYDSSQTTPLKKSSDLEEVDLNEKPFVNLESSESERRFLKNCIKCIKPLCFDEPWINKTLVKATYMSPVDMRYYGNQVGLKQRADEATETLSNASPDTSAKGHSPRTKRRLSFTKHHGSGQSPPVCIPSHKLREYVVGSHLLVPREF